METPGCRQPQSGINRELSARTKDPQGQSPFGSSWIPGSTARKHSPTLGKQSKMLLLQAISSMGWTLKSFDVKAAPAPAPATSLHHVRSQLTAPTPAPGTQHHHRRHQPVSTACTASSQHQHQHRHLAHSTSNGTSFCWGFCLQHMGELPRIFTSSSSTKAKPVKCWLPS